MPMWWLTPMGQTVNAGEDHIAAVQRTPDLFALSEEDAYFIFIEKCSDFHRRHRIEAMLDRIMAVGTVLVNFGRPKLRVISFFAEGPAAAGVAYAKIRNWIADEQVDMNLRVIVHNRATGQRWTTTIEHLFAGRLVTDKDRVALCDECGREVSYDDLIRGLKKCPGCGKELA